MITRQSLRYVNIVAYTSTISQITMDGTSVSSFFTPLESAPEFSTAQIPLILGTHRLVTSSDTGFNSYVYGYGNVDGYGFNAGIHPGPVTIGIDAVPCFGYDTHFYVDYAPDSIVSYLWQFDDGTTSTSDSPTHQFSVSGEHTVRLHVEYISGVLDSAEITFTNSSIEVHGNVLGSLCSKNRVIFRDSTVFINDVLDRVIWDFGDGSTGNGTEVEHFYSAPGTYTVTQTVYSRFGCPGSTTHIVNIAPTNMVLVIRGPAVVYSGETYEYTVNTPPNHENIWQVQGGYIIRTTDTSVFVKWTEGIPSKVSVTQIDKKTLCNEIADLVITVKHWPVFGVQGDLFACEFTSETYQTILNDNYYYDWTVINGTLENIGYGMFYVHWQSPDVGYIICKMTDKETLQEKYDTVKITIFPKPKPIIYGDTSVCINDIRNYTTNIVESTTAEWRVENGILLDSSRTNCRAQWDSVHYGYVVLILRNYFTQCIDSTKLRVTVHELPAKPVITQKGDSLISSEKYGNQWFRNGVLLAGDTSQILIAKMSGSYQVQIINTDSCISEMSMVYKYTYLNPANESEHGYRAIITPNPVNDRLTLRIDLDMPTTVQAELFNTLGEQIRVLIGTTTAESGIRQYDFDLSSIPAGMYFVRIQIGANCQTISFAKH